MPLSTKNLALLILATADSGCIEKLRDLRRTYPETWKHAKTLAQDTLRMWLMLADEDSEASAPEWAQ